MSSSQFAVSLLTEKEGRQSGIEKVVLALVARKGRLYDKARILP